ncbi:unnamed protein product [Timema podura]|uniref:UBX domain-containing protein n=1 Tax=Timema podura TaxID=61482 RepID=A0ABN7NLR3_TIMPD|nr:unnamed protein product [Timema podura]
MSLPSQPFFLYPNTCQDNFIPNPVCVCVCSEIPTELVRESHGSEVHLNMEDHRHEDFVTPKNKLNAFGGKGHVLGSWGTVVEPREPGSMFVQGLPNSQDRPLSPAPATVGAVKPADEKDQTANEEQAKDSLNVDKALPTTTIQIRLADGSRLIGQFNHTHTIGDVRSYINIARPQYQNQNFSLLTTFPSKELSDNSVTLSDAGILNAAVMQRLT